MNTKTCLQRPAAPQRQRGVVLFMALIALVALTLAGLAMVRSVDTGNVIAGNMAFRQAAMHRADVGIEAAFLALPAIVSSSKDTDIANQYYAIRQNVDAIGVPSTVAWSSVPCRNSANASVTCDAQDYKVKYVIDRLCERQTTGSTTVTDLQGYCFVDIGDGKTGSKGAFQAVFTSASAVYYRITVQVAGPRNTFAYVQAIVTKN
jgi:Tfp pilus assembly protein PilX